MGTDHEGMRVFCFFLVLFFSVLGSALAQAPATFKVLTFNSWLLDIPVGLGFRTEIAQDMDERLQLLPEYLAATDADIIVLQEVWSQRSKRFLSKALKTKGYPYSAYTSLSNWLAIFEVEMGDGLLVLSKYPISKNVQTYDFSVATQGLESFSKKGALKLQIKVPNLGWIDFYASHAGAVDFEQNDYKSDQVARHSKQIQELAAFIQRTRSHAITVLGADLNMHYQKWKNHAFAPEFSDDYVNFKQHACGAGYSMVDTYLKTHGKGAKETPDYTFTRANPYVDHGFFDTLPSEVEDYIFLCENSILRPVTSAQVFQDAIQPETVKSLNLSLNRLPKRLSDHFGVMTTFMQVGSALDEDTQRRLASAP